MPKSMQSLADHVEWHFANYVKKWERPDFTRERLYMEAFQEMLKLQKYSIWPEGAEKSFDELTVLMFGKTQQEIHDMTTKFAENNVRSFKKMEPAHIITPEEYQIIENYHSYLFSDERPRNMDPFDKAGKMF